MTDQLSRVTAGARLRRGLAWWAPPAVYASAIFWLSSLSAPPSPPPQLTDKHVHMLVFAGLAALLVRALARGRWSGVTRARGLQALAVAVAYGALDEWHQSFVPGRQSDVWDLLADAGGAALAIAVLIVLAGRSRRGQRPDGTIERAA